MSSNSAARSSAAPATIILFDRSRQNLTRAREAKIRNTFPFLRLPAELRNNVYEYCLDTDAAQRILQRYYEALKDTKDTKTVAAPLIYAKCPVIFRLNRQIYAESSFLVKKRDLTFDHGLMDLLTIKDFVPESLIRTVSSIDIDDSGHPLFKENILAASWMGYITLIEELAGILKSGHNLKKFSITLTHQELVPHVTTCWNNTHTCGFRDSLKRAAAALRGVQNIPEVKLVGFPEHLALELQRRMKSAPTSFLNLPRELRDLVYDAALDWSDISSKLKNSLDACADKHYDVKYPQRSTPTVLLLNRQITSEALTVLHNKPLVIDCPAEHHLLKERQVPNVMRFITRPTLQNVRHLILNLGATNTQITSFPHNLKTMHIVFRDNLKTRFLADTAQHYPDNTLHESLQPLSQISGLERVVVEGDLPSSYSEPLKAIMMSPLGAKRGLPKLMAVKSNGEVVDAGQDNPN
ncbi:hypothetical protein KC361_g5169 [Hortaea werneckii]|nr:hypothetical protein KC361_g5169 [Hortaea werneckii]